MICEGLYILYIAWFWILEQFVDFLSLKVTRFAYGYIVYTPESQNQKKKNCACVLSLIFSFYVKSKDCMRISLLRKP